MTLDRSLDIEAAGIASAHIDGSGHLILVRNDTTTVDAGSVVGSVGSATTSAQGIVELATSSETTTGTDATRAVTPAGLASVVALLQPADTDLTTIAALSPAANDIIQFVSGAWANRTMAQLKTAMSIQQSDVSGLTAALALLAPLASPTFTGTVTAANVTITGRQVITPDTVSVSSGHVAIDASLGNVFEIAANANFTLDNPTNPTNGQVIHLRITQDATGSRTITLGSAWNAGPLTITLSTAANKIDHLVAMYNSTAAKWAITGFAAGY